AARPSDAPAPARTADAPRADAPTPPASSAAQPHRRPGPAPRPTLSEAELLARAQAAVARSPRRALHWTARHRRAFPAGALTQEREVLAIDALSRLGRQSSARPRAEAFLRRHPRSAHAGAVRRMLARMNEAPE
ncbi:MAG TPA: hypothetical protein RMH99_03655, partial [Sandaracinaceae bacterium LLY-WYZ-13_1]|nr:hypothetical protein [Sandaracinaceae bacterium LLY-WYZ-13_1]